MNFWDHNTIAATLGGRWLSPPSKATPPTDNPGVGIDSRTVGRGQIFFALRGDRHDGHDFLAQAAERGASLLIVDRPEAAALRLRLDDSTSHAPSSRSPENAAAILAVPDTGLALLALAAAWRRELSATRVIAVTGSNGKTTTTRLIEGVLSPALAGVASIKSFNNRVGVPLTILRARPSDRFLACEVGTNAIGEIAELAPVVAPDITVITSIGREHLEGLGGLDGSSREAVELIKSLRPCGVAIVPHGIPQLERALTDALAARGNAPIRVERFGESPDCDWRLANIASDLSGVRFTLAASEAALAAPLHVGDDPITAPVLGRHNASNAAVAAVVAAHFALTPELIRRGLSQSRGADMRLQHARLSIRAGGPEIDVLNDAYNANPESMLAAIDAFSHVFGADSGRRRVAILGEMRELGEQAPDCHREIGEAAARSGAFDLLVLVGPLMMFAAERAKKILSADRVVPIGTLDDAAIAEAAACIRPGDAVLLKASRGVGLERILSRLTPTSADR